MRHGHETEYPFSPPPHRSCCRALDTVSIDMISLILFMLPVLLPRGRIQEIKRMYLAYLAHGLFLTWTQRLYFITDYILQYLRDNDAPNNPTPCFPPTRVYLLGEPASFLLDANIHPLFSLVCWQLPHPLLVLPPFHNPQINWQYLHRRHQQHQPSSSGTLPAKLAIRYRNIFSFFDILKRTFKFWASDCHVKGPLPPPPKHEVLLGRAACARSELGGAWHGRSYFSYLGWQDFHGPCLIWHGFVYFWYLSQKGIIVGGKSWSKTYKENISPGIWFFRIFCSRDFWAVQ